MQRVRRGIAIIGGVLSVVYLAMAMKYPMGSLSRPGPRVYPLFVGILLLVSSLGIGLGAKSKPASDQSEWPKGEGQWRMLAVLAASLIYVVALPYLGHLITSAGVMMVVLHVMGMRSWLLKIGLALVIGIGSLYLFSVILGVPLPRGIFQFL